jgi:hypothetical protein
MATTVATPGARPKSTAKSRMTLLPAYETRQVIYAIPLVPTKAFLHWTFGRDTVVSSERSLLLLSVSHRCSDMAHLARRCPSHGLRRT